MIEFTTQSGLRGFYTAEYADLVCRHPMPVPRAHEIIVRQVGRETVSAGGIIIPEAQRYDQSSVRDEFPPRGAVLAVGSAVEDVKPGDEIYFERREGCRAMVPDTRELSPKEWENILVMTDAHVALVLEVAVS